MAQPRPDEARTAAQVDLVGLPAGADASPLRSFWMGGFEGADHLNVQGVPLDMARLTGHLERLDEDYARAAARGLRSLRESIGWRLAEPQPGRYDFGRLRAMALAARRQGVQLLWTLMHYGTPPDVSLLDDALIGRFARFAAAVAEAVRALSDEPPVYNLINEIGFLAWAASATPLIHPYRPDLAESAPESTESSGYALKRRLVRAILAGVAAVRRVDPRARFLHVEPLVHVIAPPGRPDLQGLAAQIGSYQWQAWDLIAGRAEPELGGDSGALDLIGVNHYHSGQWEVKTENRLWWHLRHPRRRALSTLLGDAWRRYRRPLLIAETGHVGGGRAAWLHEVADEVETARARGIPVGGICLYPLIDRPDWNDAAHWHHSGLWNVESDGAGAAPPDADIVGGGSLAAPLPGRRLLQLEYADALAAWQRRLPRAPAHDAVRPPLLVLTHRRWATRRSRLQPLLRELAHHYRIVVVEEPVECPFLADEGADALEPRRDRIVDGPGLEVLVPRVRPGATGIDASGWAGAVKLLGEFVRREDIADADVWATSPRALPWLARLAPRSLTYDCADGIGSGAVDVVEPEDACETRLLELADRVLVDTPAQAERLGRLHPAVHWIPDVVDAERFRPGRLGADSEEADAAWRAQRHIATPRLGYCGPIDDRLDLEAIAVLADRCPDCEVVMIGAIDAIEPGRLPRRRNVHWLGAQPHGRLPHFVAGWDVCLLPLRNDATTRLVCPSEALELLAAEKPVVATALPELVRLHGAFIRTAADAEAFAAACIAALDTDPAAHFERVLATRAMLSGVSWERSAERVRRLLEQPPTAQARRRVARRATPQAVAARP